MKKWIFTLLAAVFVITSVFSQTPDKMCYQAVIRDIDNILITDQTIGMQISILQGSEGGTVVYSETQTPATNGNGLVSIEIGTGNSSENFSSIDWSTGTFFIKTETDPTGGTSYSIVGTSQLLSTPYALHAKTAESLTGEITITETDPKVPAGSQVGEMQYWNGSAWVTLASGNDGNVLIFTGGVPTWQAQLEDGDVKNPITGKIWMDKNLGASQVATSSTDAAAYGDLYQWGRTKDGHQNRTSSPTYLLSGSDTPGNGDFIIVNRSPYDWRSSQNNNLWQGLNGTNNPCPAGYRLPTEAELEAERQSWSSSNAAGAFASPLKLTLAGNRHRSNASLDDVGSYGAYWTSTTNGMLARYIYFTSGVASMNSSFRAYGYSVRCIKD